MHTTKVHRLLVTKQKASFRCFSVKSTSSRRKPSLRETSSTGFLLSKDCFFTALLSRLPQATCWCTSSAAPLVQGISILSERAKQEGYLGLDTPGSLQHDVHSWALLWGSLGIWAEVLSLHFFLKVQVWLLDALEDQSTKGHQGDWAGSTDRSTGCDNSLCLETGQSVKSHPTCHLYKGQLVQAPFSYEERLRSLWFA